MTGGSGQRRLRGRSDHALDPNATADVLEDVDRRLVISLGLRRVAISACSARHTWLVRLQSLRPQA